MELEISCSTPKPQMHQIVPATPPSSSPQADLAQCKLKLEANVVSSPNFYTEIESPEAKRQKLNDEKLQRRFEKLEADRKRKEEKLEFERKKREERIEAEKKRKIAKQELENQKREERLKAEQQRQQEKMIEAQQREELKKQREAERQRQKQLKLEQEQEIKRQREREKQRKEDERREKEEERRQKEEEARRKKEELEGKQLKLAQFFEKKVHKLQDNDSKEPELSAYKQDFLSFRPKPNSVWYKPIHSPGKANSVDKFLLSNQSDPSQNLQPNIKDYFPTPIKRKCWNNVEPVSELMRQIQDPECEDTNIILKQLEKQNFKIFKFFEDVRPPYCGTWTRKPNCRGLQTGRNFLLKSEDMMNYDYYSEAEWQEGDDEDGEDLDAMTSSDDDELVDEPDDTLDDFVDDEMLTQEPRPPQRATFGAPLFVSIKVNANAFECNEISKSDKDCTWLKGMKCQILLMDVNFPIDPLKEYHQIEVDGEATTQVTTDSANTMDHLCSKLALPVKSSTSQPEFPADPTSTSLADAIQSQDLFEIIKAVQGSNSTLLFLVEILHQKLPTYTKKFIQDLIKQIAQRNGKRGSSASIWQVKQNFLEMMEGKENSIISNENLECL